MGIDQQHLERRVGDRGRADSPRSGLPWENRLPSKNSSRTEPLELSYSSGSGQTSTKLKPRATTLLTGSLRSGDGENRHCRAASRANRERPMGRLLRDFTHVTAPLSTRISRMTV